MGSWQERLALCWHVICWQTIYYGGKSQGRQMSRGSKIIVAWTCRTVPQRIKSGQHVTPETLTAIACTENSCRNSLTWLICHFWMTRAKNRISRASRHGLKEHQKVLIRQKSAQTTVSIKHCILTEKVFVRWMAFIIFLGETVRKVADGYILGKYK